MGVTLSEYIGKGDRRWCWNLRLLGYLYDLTSNREWGLVLIP
jgi:hypothetical protein